MKFSRFLWALPACASVASAFNLFDDVDTYGIEKYQRLVDDLNFITDKTITKRDDQSTLEGILSVVGQSGFIEDLLYSIAKDDNQINALINLTSSLVDGASVSLGGLNVSLNLTEIWNTVLESKLIPGVAWDLLYNDTNFKIINSGVCLLLESQVYVPKLLVNLGKGDDLTVQMIADTIKYTPNLNPKYNSSLQDNGKSKQAVLAARDQVFAEIPNADETLYLRADNQNEGSAAQFFSNVIGTAIGNGVVNSTLSDVLVAINNSHIAAPLIINIITNSTILSMFPKLTKGLYDNGVFNGISLKEIYREAKKSHILADALQTLLTHPVWEPPIGNLLHNCEANGTYHEIQVALYGPKK